MDRRTLLLGAGALTITAGMGATAASAAPEESGSSTKPVFTWDMIGGFMPAGFAELRAAPMVVYPDGVAIADATKRLRLNRRALESLCSHAVRVLRDPANARPRPDAPIITDIPEDVLSVRAPGGRRHRLQYNGLTETRTYKVYPRAAYELYDHMAAVRDKALRDGVPYRPDAVKLLASLLDTAPTTVSPWPTGVPVPTIAKDAIFGELHLRGARARATVRGISPGEPWQWQVFRTADGRVLSANWRYLLPHE